MIHIFTSGDRAQDLINWAERIEAIGGAIAELEGYDGNSIIPHLGEVVCDYSSALKTVLSTYYSGVQNVMGKVKSLEIVEIEQEYDRIKNLGPEFRSIDYIREALEKVQDFKAKVSSVFDIEADLKNRLNDNSKKAKGSIIKEAV